MWIFKKFRCGKTEMVEDSKCPSTKGTTSREASSCQSPSSSSCLSTVLNPVVYIDKEGLEWAMNDGVPDRPPTLAKNALFIPFEIRPRRGFLKNQVLTDCEVPDVRSPVPGSIAPRVSLHTEHILRKLRSRSIEVGESSGAHIRSRSGKHLIRRDLALKRLTTILKESPEYSDRLKPPSQRVAAGLDVSTYLAMRARMAAHRK